MLAMVSLAVKIPTLRLPGFSTYLLLLTRFLKYRPWEAVDYGSQVVRFLTAMRGTFTENGF